ncbi:MAG: carboxypeptidase regulatory-like domain-containing protein [Planctomycetes bacterium]|nr:carboxypeptidase regulatory-like domain-containing protein [Planctomycetota bacterium]
MAGERTKRPTTVLAAWTVLLLTAFVVRGDLTVAPPAPSPRPVRPTGPVVVKAESARLPARSSISCRGRVLDALGFLVVGAEVETADRGIERTDADGEFRLDVADGSFVDVLVRAKGLQSRRLRMSPSTPNPVLVQLPPSAPWDHEPAQLPAASRLLGEGTVRNQGGEPVAGAWVTTVGGDAWSRTDEFGRYVLSLPQSPVTLLVHQPDGSGETPGLVARTEPIDVARTDGRVPLPEVVAMRAGVIRGVVRDPRGEPVEGVPVQVQGEGIARVLETGAGGAFRLGGLHPGRYVVRPFAFRGALGAPQDVVLADAVVDCDLRMQSAAERRLRLLNERGAPVAHALVAAEFAGERSAVAETDADGFAALVVAEAAAPSVEFEVRAGEALTAVEVRRFEADSATLVVDAP